MDEAPPYIMKDKGLPVSLTSIPSDGTTGHSTRPPKTVARLQDIPEGEGRFESRTRAYYAKASDSSATPTACGTGQAAMRPFYSPTDQKVFIDPSFYRDLKELFHAPGEFAQAGVITHEVGHHVQNLLGLSDKVRQSRQGAGKAKTNAVTVRFELQADCFAGVWGQRADTLKHIIEAGVIEQALNAASAISDDRPQQQSQGRIAPESITHGTSAPHVRGFKGSMDSGDLRRCDTFKAPSP